MDLPVKIDHDIFWDLFWDSPQSVECVSLWINLLLIYPFVAHWVLPAMKHQEPELNWSPETTSVISIKRLWVQIPMWILARFELRCVVSRPNLHCTISLPWYKFYSWRININTVLLNKVHTLQEGSLFVLYWFMDFVKCTLSRICHYSIIQNTITALKTPWVPPIDPSFPSSNFWKPLILYCPYSFAFKSQMSYAWNYKVFSLFSLASFT